MPDPQGTGAAVSGSLITYLITDQQVLGALSWVAAAITAIGFAVTIWQLLRVKRAAEAGRIATLGLEHKVRSRELLVQLQNAHNHLETARNHVARGERGVAMACLELSASAIIEARELSKGVAGDWTDLQPILVRLRRASQQLMGMDGTLQDHTDFFKFVMSLRGISDIVRKNLAQSRYIYDEE